MTIYSRRQSTSVRGRLAVLSNPPTRPPAASVAQIELLQVCSAPPGSFELGPPEILHRPTTGHSRGGSTAAHVRGAVFRRALASCIEVLAVSGELAGAAARRWLRRSQQRSDVCTDIAAAPAPAAVAPKLRPTRLLFLRNLGLLPDVPAVALLRVHHHHVELHVTPVTSAMISVVSLNDRRVHCPDPKVGNWRVAAARRWGDLCFDVGVTMADGREFQERIELVLR